MPTGAGGGSSSPKGWPLNYFSTGLSGTNGGLSGANAVTIQGFYLPASLTFSRIVINVGVSDASNNYDFGIYNLAGTLLANQGPAHVTSTGFVVTTMLQGAQTINPGTYLFAWVGAATTANLQFNNVAPNAVFNNNAATAVSATLPASIGAVAISPASVGYQLSFY